MRRTHMNEERFSRHPGPRGFGDGEFGPPWGRGRGRGPRGRGRARRGDVRAAVLALLAERPMHGYEMIQVLDERTGGVWKPSPGSIYPALSMLEDEGLVTVDTSTGKRLFSLTDAGREAQAADPRERAPWDEVTAGADPDFVSLKKMVGQLMMAAYQVAEAGGEDGNAKAVEILADARKRLYAILAEAD